MGTKKVLVNPEPISDESEKTAEAEAEAEDTLLQQEYDNVQRFLKESKDNPGREKEGWIQCIMKKNLNLEKWLLLILEVYFRNFHRGPQNARKISCVR